MYSLIRASAGSGKTFQLSGHFLKQLFLGQSPETILATTFTRKAAGEILGRVLLRLATAAESKAECEKLADFMAPATVTQERAKELLAEVTAQLHRMRVCTLDSFFQQLARSLTLELGLPPGWKIIDEPSARKLRQEAIDAVLSQQMPKDAQRLMQMLANGKSKRSVRDLIDDTVLQFHELFQLTNTEAWQKIPRLNRLTRKEQDLALREVSEKAADGDATLAKTVRADLDRFHAGQWEKFIDTGIAKKVFAGETKFSRKEIPAALVEAYDRLITHAKAELLEAVAQQTKATYNLIDRFDREYSRLRSEHGWMGFNDITRALARSQDAASGPRMNFRMDSALQHLLLDEFQDTSPDQWHILRRLALNIAASPDNTSLFCVGDPKQAIYGWRGGVAAILDAVEQTMPDIQATTLDQSRRSSSEVINTVNRVFQHLVKHKNLNDYGPSCFRWQDKFPPHSTVHETLPGFAQLRTSPELEGESAEERRNPYYQWVALQIKELHQQCPGAEIGVLTRKNHTVARLVHELRLLGVPASEEGGTAPTDSPAVLAVLSLLHLASHPGCEISRFHVANSPLAELVRLNTWKDDVAACNTATEIRNRLMDEGYGRTLQWLSEAVRPHCGQRDLLRLQQIVAEGWQFDVSPSLNPAEFAQLLQNSRLNRSENAPIRVMTVHQSKGLEFEIVVLPELDSRLFRPPNAAAGTPSPGESPDQVCIWRKRTIRNLLPISLQNAFEQTISRDVSEALCLLYVALTRAEHALYMFIPPITSAKPPATFAGVLLAALSEDQVAPADHVIYEEGSPEWYMQEPQITAQPTARPDSSDGHRLPTINLAPRAERRRGLRREAPSRHDDTRLYLSSQSKTKFHGNTAVPIKTDPRTRGNVIHAWFEQIDWLDDGVLPTQAELLKVVEWTFLPEQQLRTLLVEFMSIVQRSSTQTALSTIGNSQLPQFQPFATDIQTGKATFRVEQERPFVLKRDGAIVQGTIDRLVLLELNGKPVAADILDFKTDRISENVNTWIADKVSHYGPQLEEYRNAVASCFRIPDDAISSRLMLLEADVVVSTQTTGCKT